MRLRIPVFSICCLILLASCSNSPSVAQSPEAAYIQKANTYLVKDESIRGFYKIDSAGVCVYPGPQDKANDQNAVCVYWDEIEPFKMLTHSLDRESLMDLMKKKGSSRFRDVYADSLSPLTRAWSKPADKSFPLLGLKIAIDPGHVGGSMELAEMEKKYVKLKAGSVPGYPAEIAFNEGNLTVATGILLKDKLEKVGAQVLMTRDTIAETAFGMTFPEWKDSLYPETLKAYAKKKGLSQDKIDWWLNSATDEQIFHGIFKNADLEERARVINAWKPDLTIFLHYNIEETNEADNDLYLTPQKNNYSMAFIPGSFMKGEMDSLDTRIDFMRLLLCEDLAGSENLSGLVMDKVIRLLQVPPVSKDADLRYIQKASLAMPTTGVFARNLSLTRLVHGKMCFMEPLLQDNETEAIRLNSIDYRVGGMRTSLRCKQTAEAYFQGILAWAIN